MQNDISALNNKFKSSLPKEILEYFLSEYKNKIGFSTSLSIEDQVITDIIAGIDKSAKIFTLDTGRLFYETYSLIQSTNDKYGINIEVYFPNHTLIEEMIKSKGVNLFYESIDNRKLCCNNRKIEPLKRAFKGLDVWISGLRREQSITRTEIKTVEWDETYQMIKVNPIIDWSEEEVWNYIRKNKVPYNTLHDKGYASIGCAPCTRPINKGEDVRAGRWWWENPEHKECGLHIRTENNNTKQ